MAAPAVTFVILLIFGKIVPISDELFYAILIPAACPCAVTGTMMAMRYDKDYEYASQVFVVCTLLSMVTIPLLAGGARALTG